MNRLWVGLGVMAAAAVLTGCDDDDDGFASAGSAAGIFWGSINSPVQISTQGHEYGLTVIGGNGRTVAIGDTIGGGIIYHGNTNAPNPFNNEPGTSDSDQVAMSGNYRSYEYYGELEDDGDIGDRIGMANLAQGTIDSESDYCYYGGDPDAIEDEAPLSNLWLYWDKEEDGDIDIIDANYCAEIENDSDGGSSFDTVAWGDYLKALYENSDDIDGVWYLSGNPDVSTTIAENGSFELDLSETISGDCTLNGTLNRVTTGYNAFNASGSVACDGDGSVGVSGLAWWEDEGTPFGRYLWVAYENTVDDESYVLLLSDYCIGPEEQCIEP